MKVINEDVYLTSTSAMTDPIGWTIPNTKAFALIKKIDQSISIVMNPMLGFSRLVQFVIANSYKSYILINPTL